MDGNGELDLGRFLVASEVKEYALAGLRKTIRVLNSARACSGGTRAVTSG